jgi:hypothetical protein
MHHVAFVSPTGNRMPKEMGVRRVTDIDKNRRHSIPSFLTRYLNCRNDIPSSSAARV